MKIYAIKINAALALCIGLSLPAQAGMFDALQDQLGNVTKAAEQKLAGVSDQELSAQYQKEFNAFNNDLRSTHISKMTDAGVDASFRARLVKIKAIADSFSDARNKKQFQSNYASLERNFNQRVASAEQQAASQKKQDLARKSDGAQRAQPRVSSSDAAALADASRQADFQARADARKKLAADREARNAALRTQQNPSHQTASVASGNYNDADTHKQFGRAYQDVRVSLQYLQAAELNEPREGAYWKRKLNEFADIVAKFQNKDAPDVKSDLQTYAEMKTKLEGLLASSEKSSLASYPEYASDLDTFKQLEEKYRSSAVFTKESAPRARILNDAYNADKQRYDALVNKYEAFLQGNRNSNHPAYREANEMRRWIKKSDENLSSFYRTRKDFYADLQPELMKRMDKAERLRSEAVATENTSVFNNGAIERQLEKAEALLFVYKTVAGEMNNSFASYRKKLDQLTHKVEATSESLSKNIIDTRQTPDDKYLASNRAQILQLNREAFQKKFPDKKILAEGVYGSEGERKTFTEWNSSMNAWVHKDYTEIYVWIITAKSAEVATLFSSWVYVNHMKNDRLTAYGYKKDAKGRDMLMKNVRR